MLHEIGDEETVSIAVWEKFQEGEKLYAEAKYQEAITKYKEALTLHGHPSRVIENRLGLSYDILGLKEQAIVHFSNAIQIKDTSLNRVNRSLTYHELGLCDSAIIDATIALLMEPASKRGYHTDVEASYVLSDCYFWKGDYERSLKHIEDAIRIAKNFQYSDEEIEFMEEEREIIKSYVE